MRTLLLATALFVTTAVFVTTAAPTPTQQGSVAGSWVLNFTGPQGPIEAVATFTQDGENVTGTIDGPQGVVECTGTLKATKLALSLSVNAGGQSMTIYMLGDVDGDSIKGTWSYGDGSNEWSGKKKN
jgi:hypothetical protein